MVVPSAATIVEETEAVAVVDDAGLLRGSIDRVCVVNALARRSQPTALGTAAP